MKLIHLSDLHLGKRVNEFSMIEDQQYILLKILGICEEEKPDAVLLSGDIYDRSLPPEEAVRLFDELLSRFAGMKIPVFAISGNHDSAERIAFGGRLMHASGVYLSPVYRGEIRPVELTDEYGPVRFYLLPFLKPLHVRRYHPEETIETYTDAIRTVVREMKLDTSVRNVLLAHQLVTGAVRSESEDVSIGGLDNVDADVFEDFDYTALGHLHRPQNVGSEKIRYCGTPLKYSFAEADHDKSVSIVTLGEKGQLSVRTVPLVPLRDMREIRGSYEELTSKENYAGTATDDYLHVILTDEEDVPDAVARLRTIYPNIMKLDYDNVRTRSGGITAWDARPEEQTPLALIGEFYEKQNGKPMDEAQQAFCEELIGTIWEEER